MMTMVCSCMVGTSMMMACTAMSFAILVKDDLTFFHPKYLVSVFDKCHDFKFKTIQATKIENIEKLKTYQGALLQQVSGHSAQK